MLNPIVGDRRCYSPVVTVVKAELGRCDAGGDSDKGGGEEGEESVAVLLESSSTSRSVFIVGG